MRNLEILNKGICGPTLTGTVRATFPPSPIPISVGRSVPAEPLNRLSAHRDGFALPSE
jgi:hypothetical protein